jgi:hypothetical protein
MYGFLCRRLIADFPQHTGAVVLAPYATAVQLEALRLPHVEVPPAATRS